MRDGRLKPKTPNCVPSRPTRSRSLGWWLAIWLAAVWGCPQPKPPKTPAPPTTTSEAERPPLRVLVMGHESWSETVVRRWQSISEQRLDLQSIDSNRLESSTTIKADILIVESRWLPTCIERGWVAPLPKQVLQAISPPTDEPSRPIDWPIAWRRSATYGQALWGIPLGVPMLCAVTRSKPNDELPLAWKDRLDGRLARPFRGIDKKNIEATGPDDFLVDRFLCVAASLNPQPNDMAFLFNVHGVKARLNEPWLIQAAELFGRLFSEQSDFALATPEATWDAVSDQKIEWGLAWPSAEGESSLSLEATKPWVDTGRGLVAMVTRKNRQSAPSNRFLLWLNEEDQRQESMKRSSTMQASPDQWPSVSDRADVDRYRELMKWALEDTTVVRELRFAESFRYRQLLADTLRRILQNPSNASVEMERCAAEWDAQTSQIGRDLLKHRLAKSLDLEKQP